MVILEALGGSGEALTYAWDDAKPDGLESFDVIHEVRGRASSATHAVSADWEVSPEGDAAQFERSREDLFSLRREHLPSFHCDWLLRNTKNRHHYVVLGLYESEEALAQARSHLAIAAWAKTLPADLYGAVSGPLQTFRIAAYRR